MKTRLAPRGYQRSAIESTWRHLKKDRAALVVLPSGGGKTLVLAKLAERWPGRVLVVEPKRGLVDRAVEELQRNTDLSIGVERATQRAGRDEDVVVGTWQSLIRRLDKYNSNHFGLIIVDECDLAKSPSYGRIFDYFSTAKVFGCTATPHRHDGQNVLDIFKTVTHEETLEDFIEAGYLARLRRKRIQILEISRERLQEEYRYPKMKGGDFDPKWLDKVFSKEKELHAVVRPMLEVADDRPTIVFAASIRHAQLLAALFNRPAYRPGCARAIWGSDPNRAKTEADFRAGKFQFLVNCALIDRGVDMPFVSCIGMARPTLSHTMYMQMIGRGTRIAEGKKDLLVVDFTFNSEVHQLTAVDMLAKRIGPVKDMDAPTEDEVAERAGEILEAGGDGDVLEARQQATDELKYDPVLCERIRAKVRFRLDRVKGIDWDKVGLGRRPDRLIAAELGFSVGPIRNARIARNISVFKTFRSQKNIDWDSVGLGKKPDTEIAKETGTNTKSVWRARITRNISVFKSKTLGKKIDWDKAELGTRSDSEIAREYEVTTKSVQNARNSRNIPAFKPPKTT